jgi:GT2 family glycosyltransferase
MNSNDDQRQAGLPSPVIAVVVTHNRYSDLTRLLAAVQQQTRTPDAVVIVDNASSDDTSTLAATLNGAICIRLPFNAGGAGGFEVGRRIALQCGASWLWLLDDDCVPDRDCLDRLMSETTRCSGRVAALCPGIGENPRQVTFGYLRNPSTTLTGGRGVSACELRGIDWSSFVGLLLRAEASTQVGSIRDDFFLWNDDTEYCLRLRTAGWDILSVPQAFVYHRGSRRLTRQWFRLSLSVRQNEPWLDFYGTRNLLYVDWLYRSTPLRNGQPFAIRLLHEVRSAVKVAVVDHRHGMERARRRLEGLLAAIQLIITRKPRFAAARRSANVPHRTLEHDSD